MSSRISPAIVLAGVVLAFALWPADTLAAWPYDPGTNVPVCTFPFSQYNPVSVPDGAGGVIIAWRDQRNIFNPSTNVNDIFAMRVTASGALAPGWPAGGLAVCTDAWDQTVPQICSDGAGGAIIAWNDTRASGPGLYAQRVTAGGAIAPGWPVDGALVSLNGAAFKNSLVADGASGAIFAFSKSTDVYANRLTATGAVAPGWSAGGVVLCNATGNQSSPAVVEDGAGGAIVAWQDQRNFATSGTDIYAIRLTGAGTLSPGWLANGIEICRVTGEALEPVITTDGAGGAILAWRDFRGGSGGIAEDVYALHASAAGVIPAWQYGGVGICTAANQQTQAALVPDGSGGAVLAWVDYRVGNGRVYAQRFTSSGVGAWTANGVALCSDLTGQGSPVIAADGTGGAIVAWVDARNGNFNSDLYTQRIGPSGSLAPGWGPAGVALSTSANNQLAPAIAANGAGGAVVVWEDRRENSPNSVANNDIYCQRIEHFGQLGEPEPDIVRVADVRNDQGGRVLIEWTRSYLDAEPEFSIAFYSIWRRVPSSLALALLAGAASSGETTTLGKSTSRQVRSTVEQGQTVYWEYVASQPARGRAGYSYVATTEADSTSAANPHTSFAVEAEVTGGIPFWASAPESSYSVDNLAPSVPGAFAGVYASGTTALHWVPNTEADFARYDLHRGSSPGFAPGPGNLVAQKPDTGFVDVAGAPYFYKLLAVDSHGNRSTAALLQPTGTVDAALPPLSATLELARPHPNPARSDVDVRFVLPRASSMSLAIFDASGRRVRVLLEGLAQAGAQGSRFDLTDDAGRPLSGGLYFVRLEAAGRAQTRRLAVVR